MPNELTFRALCKKVLAAEDLIIPANPDPEYELEYVALTRLIEEIRNALNDSERPQTLKNTNTT